MVLCSLKYLFQDFLTVIGNWDSRLWRTLIPLWLRPGFLSAQYTRGHRAPYVPPLRLYLFSSIIAFLILAQITPKESQNQNIGRAAAAKIQVETAAGEETSLAELLDRTNAEVEAALPAPAPGRQRTNASGQWRANTLEVPFLSEQAQQQLNERYAAVLQNPKLLVDKLFSLAPQMLFVLLPLFALLLKLLYIRSGRYYMEHLIVALHSHSFLLQISVLYIGLSALEAVVSWHWLAQGIGWAAWLVLWWIPLYLLLCQKFYYQQGWGKTLLKFWLTSSIYNLLLAVAMLGLVILSILWA